VNLKPSITLTVILLIFSQAQIYPQNTPSFPRLEADPKALEYHNLGVINGGYSWQELAEISLWASGNTSSSAFERISSIVSAINSSADLPSASAEKAEFLLTYLHRNVLRTYSLHQTRVDTVFTNGVYNCVSSAVLYIILCESAGIKTSGVITKEHAFVIVHIDGQNIDVETTNRFGFDPGNRKEFHDQFGRLTGFSYVPVQNYRDRQTISNIELISIILNNRIAEHERRNRYADAVPVAIDRAALLYGDSLAINEINSSNIFFVDPRKDLMDRLINYGVTLLRANREEDSIRWAKAASEKYNDPVRWQEYSHAAVNNRISRFIRERKVTEAREFLENNKDLLSEAGYAQLDAVITNIYRSNLAVDYHNRFAAEWNRRNYDEAERILNEGLTEFPDNRQLLNNRETVNRHRARNN